MSWMKVSDLKLFRGSLSRKLSCSSFSQALRWSALFTLWGVQPTMYAQTRPEIIIKIAQTSKKEGKNMQKSCQFHVSLLSLGWFLVVFCWLEASFSPLAVGKNRLPIRPPAEASDGVFRLVLRCHLGFSKDFQGFQGVSFQKWRFTQKSLKTPKNNQKCCQGIHHCENA